MPAASRVFRLAGLRAGSLRRLVKAICLQTHVPPGLRVVPRLALAMPLLALRVIWVAWLWVRHVARVVPLPGPWRLLGTRGSRHD